MGLKARLGAGVSETKRSASRRAPPGATADELRLLTELAQLLPLAEDAESLQRGLLARSLELLECRSGAVCLWEEKGTLRMSAAVGRGEALSPGALLGAEPVLNVLMHERRPLALEHPGLTLGAELEGWQGLAMAPLLAGDRAIGFLLVGDRQRGAAFGTRDVAMVEVVAGLMSAGLEMRLAFERFRSEMDTRMKEARGELARAGAALASLKTFNEDLFDSLPAGIIVFDRAFRVTFRNAAAEHLWPTDRSVLDAARRTHLERSDPDWESNLRSVVEMRCFWRAEQVVYEPPGREAVRVNLASSPLFSGKREVIGGVLVVEDDTQRALMEKRLAVSERLAGVGRLAAMVAHEVNNPLDGIIRLVGLARRVAAAGEDPRAEKYLAEADKGLARLVAIVRDLLEFSRSASQTPDPMPIAEVLLEAADAVRPEAEKAGVELAVTCAPEVPPLRSAMLYHVVVNLVKNAVEAMSDGGRVEVAARAGPDALLIEVADTGPGLPPEALGHLFEPFYSRKAHGKGTGLGLVICKDLVEKQGGTIEAANRPEGGARFTVRMPIVSGVPPAAE